MIIHIGNNILIEDPSDEIEQFVKEELILANPDYAKKQRMGFSVRNVPKVIYLYERRGDSLILPFGTLRKVLRLSKGSKYLIEFTKEDQSVDYQAEIPLYDYQEEAVNALMDSTFGILKSRTGSGKTRMAIALIAKYGKRALWLTHTGDLLKQSYDSANQFIDASLLGTITNGQVNIGKGITFATVQTMSKIDLSAYKDYWDVIVCDECHHTCGSPTAVTQFYKVLSNLRARHKFGLSATVHRADGLIKATFALIGEVVHEVPDYATSDKTMPVGIVPIPTEIPQSYEMLNTDGTLNYAKMISCLTFDDDRNDLILGLITEEARQNHSCIVLSDRVAHLEDMMGNLPSDILSKSVKIIGAMNTKKGKAEREQAISQMRTGEKRVLFATVALAKEGLDIPRLDRLFLTTPVSDEAVVIQSIGRIARTFEGKGEPVAFDFVDSFPHAVNKYKTRLRHYKKAGAYVIPNYFS